MSYGGKEWNEAKASLEAAKRALQDLPQDRERVIKEAYARWKAEKQKREANNALS